MYFIFTAVATVLAVALIYRIIPHGNNPKFTLSGSLDPAALKLAVVSLASDCLSPSPRGKGIDVRLIQKYADKCYGRIAFRAQNGRCFEFENRIYDSFFILREKIAFIKKQVKSFKNLPHCGKFPRIYLFCRLLVNSANGEVSDILLKDMIAQFNAITPLSQFETAAIPVCLELTLLEFLAIYCVKSSEISDCRLSAERDAARKRIDLNFLNEGAYIYFYLQSCDFESETAFSSLATLNDISIKSVSDKFGLLVSSYSAAAESALTTLGKAKTWLTDEYILQLSPLNRLLEGEDVVYKNCTLPTKNVYLFFIAGKAKKQRKGELALAREIVTEAKSRGEDIAKFILPKAGGVAAQRLYVFTVLLFSMAFCAGIGVVFALFLVEIWIATILAILFFPSAVAINLIIAGELNSRAAFRRYLPRVNISDSKALLLFCGLAGSKEEIRQLFFSLRTLRYSSPHANFRYGLLLDFPAGAETNEKDTELLAECKRLFGALKEDKYNVFIRRRRKIEQHKRFLHTDTARRKSENLQKKKKEKYQGWEKKRGALINLNEYLLTGGDAEFSLILGRRECPDYVITLDSDTMLNCAEELVEIMDHPFNESKTIVSVKAKTNPYTVSTAFARFMCGALGLDGYTTAAAEANYDLFDSGNYTGKGIYRLKEYNEKLKDFFPDGRILSHDFIEGAVAGCGCAEYVLDTFPANFSQYLTRSIRWLRGDWQLLPYLFKNIKNRKGEKIKNPVSPIAKWHIFCNMLLSLLPVFAFASIVLAAFLPSFTAAFWTMFMGFGYYAVVFLGTIRNSIIHGVNPLSEIFRTIFNIAVIPIIAVYNLVAIMVTLIRLIAGKKLLEWKTFAHAKGRASILPCVFAAILLSVFSFFFGYFAVIIVISVLFMSGIVLIFVLNHEYREKKYMPESVKVPLLETARKTWEYFIDSGSFSESGFAFGGENGGGGDKSCAESTKTAFSNLISDNFQEYLGKGFADRTSPTNIGFSLLAAVCAFELGFLDGQTYARLIGKIIDKIETLPKWCGNLYNWTDTKGGLLYPKYVSAVDNGNLLACLLVVESYCGDDFNVLASDVEINDSQSTAAQADGTAMDGGFQKNNGSANASGCTDKWFDNLGSDIKKRVRRLIDEMDLSRLYDKKRELLHIGYNESYKFFDGHYDLMASESMLTYLVAIGCGKIPKKSFENLSKNALKSYGRVALASWTGGLFEYLMSALFVRYPFGGMLDRSAKAAVNAHIRFARKNKLPFWGCSESQYNYTDNNGNFQYRAFGVPSIANSNQAWRGVMAPYAAFLALSVSPEKALRNLKKMESEGLCGKYGYYESYDTESCGKCGGGGNNKNKARGFLKNRDKNIRGGDVVESFMAHHQGMILAAVCNYLSDGNLIKRLRRLPSIAAAELLMTQQEFHTISKKKKPLPQRSGGSHNEILVKKTNPLGFNILNGSKYSVLYDSSGGSRSVYGSKAVSRYENGRGGFKIYAADVTEMVKNGKNHSFLDATCEKSIVYVRHSIEASSYSDDCGFKTLNDSEGYKAGNGKFDSLGDSYCLEKLNCLDAESNAGNGVENDVEIGVASGIEKDGNISASKNKTYHDYKTFTEAAADFAFIGGKSNDQIKHSGLNGDYLKEGFGEDALKNGNVFGDGLYWHDISAAKIVFSDYKNEYEYKSGDFLIKQTAIVLPNTDGEARKIAVKNLSDEIRFFALKTHIVPAMTEKSRDFAHKLFSSMKIRTELLDDMLVCYRVDEDGFYLAHFFDCGGVKYESCAYNLKHGPDIGVGSCDADFNNSDFSKNDKKNNIKTDKMPSFGAPLYPVLSGEKIIKLNPGEKAETVVYNLVAENKEALLRESRLVRSPAYFRQATTAAFSKSMLDGLGRHACELLSILYSPEKLTAHEFGTRPLVVIEADEVSEFLCRRLYELNILRKFADFEVAVIYKEIPGYFNKNLDKINYYIEKTGIKNVHTVNSFLNESRCAELKKAAVTPAVFIEAEKTRVLPQLYKNVPLALPDFDLKLGRSGFLRDSSYFIIVNNGAGVAEVNKTDGAKNKQGSDGNNCKNGSGSGCGETAFLRPWSNVVGSGGIGTIITESGGGYTFYKNSGINKITHWSNEPLNDKPSEGIVFEENGVCWSVTKNPAGKNCGHFCRHGFGYTEFWCNYNGIIITQTEFTDRENCKFKLLKMKNCEDSFRKIDVCAFLNLVLGDSRENTRGFISAEAINNGINIENTLSGFEVSLISDGKIKYYVRHKQRIFNENDAEKDINGEYESNIDLTSILDEPSVALTVEVEIKPFSEEELVFCITAKDGSESGKSKKIKPEIKNKAETESKDAAAAERENLIKKAKNALADSIGYYSNLSRIKIKTGDKGLDHLLNWLPYQTLSCRFFARAGFYQAGGAIGFRDQLQDCLSLLYISPDLVRGHILDCAAHQFEEGDVLHWWHPPATGVRTRITDDMLYLPWVVAEYIKFTGDVKILSETVPFLHGRALKDNEHDLYFSPEKGESATLYEHCLRALKRNVLSGDDLVFMGGGDWNDAMDKVGIKGNGKTVWGSMFLYFVIQQFLPYVKNSDERKELLKTVFRLKSGVDNCWDGEWFLRAFMDDGTVLGSKNSRECKIDLLSQSWAVLSGIADKKHAKTALKSAADRLVDYENGIIKLLDPPFEFIDAGYIAKYPKGVRENGGQYTHAAVWFIMALLKEDCTDFAYSLFEMLNPVNRYKNSGGLGFSGMAERYMTEPYVLCGDVYSGEFGGVAGWSWYTGAAGWYYKCFIECFLGLRIQNGRLSVNPKLPDKIRHIEVKYETDFGVLDITVDNTGVGKEWVILVDRVRYNITHILLTPALIGKKIMVKRTEQ